MNYILQGVSILNSLFET